MNTLKRGAYQSDSSRERGSIRSPQRWFGYCHGRVHRFLDSDDWIKDESLSLLYDEAVKHHADVVMGNMWLCHQDGSMDKPFKCISNGSIKELLSGKESFIELVKTCFYLPMPFKYIYNRKYLHKIQARFEEGIMHEDELWCPIVLCQAERMVITNIEFIITARTKNRSCIRQA